MFAGVRPQFLLVDEVTFQHPVDIGDLLRFRSAVVHTAPPERGETKVRRRGFDLGGGVGTCG